MDSSSLETEARRFIDAAFRVGGEWLEPEYWGFPCFDDVHSYHVIFVAKAPYAYHAEAAYKQIIRLGWQAPIAFEIWSQGASKPDSKTGLISALQRYRFESFARQQTDRERIISEWLNLAGEPEKLVVQQSDTRIIVRCGDSLQAFRLSDRLDWLVKTGLKFVEIYVGTQVLNNIALERLAKDDHHRFIYSLLRTHQAILEEGVLAIDDDKVRIYCARKEEARALHDGRWDLAERAQEQQLPQQFELFYFGDDQKPQLFKAFSIREGLLANKAQRREIAALFQDFDKE